LAYRWSLIFFFKGWVKMMCLRLLFLLSFVYYTLSYPYYIIFSYIPGKEYSIKSNDSFISVVGDGHTALYEYLPHRCDGDLLKAKKNNDNIIIEIPCFDEEVQNQNLVWV
jgi:hypothetical protein